MVKDYSKFRKAPLGAVKPEGWLKEFLLDMANGLTGNMEVAGYPYDKLGWDMFDVDTTKINENPGWWAYEQTGYALDGLCRPCDDLLHLDTAVRSKFKFRQIVA